MSWIAIDIGTYHSSAAIEVGGIIKKVRPLGSSSDSCSFPTVAYVSEDHNICVCAEANAWKCQDPSRFIKDFKYDIHQGKLAFLDVAYSDVISEIIKSIKVSAESMLEGQHIENVMLSIPNHYGESDPRIDILKKAAQTVGFNRIEFIRDSLATSYHYGVEKHEGYVMIYDLGESIFTPSLIKSCAGKLSLVSSSTGIDLGGKYFDEKLYNRLLENNHINYSDDEETQIQQISSIMAMCREVKEQLSEFIRVSHPVPIKGSGVFNVEKAEFENLITPILEKSYEECDSVLHQAGVEWKDISQVILVGGSANIPCVSTLFNKYLNGKNANVNIVHNNTIEGDWADSVYSVCLGAMKYILMRSDYATNTYQQDIEDLSLKERGLIYYNGNERRKNWLLAAYFFYRVLLEGEDEECYNYLLQIFHCIINNLRIVDGTLALEPILNILGEDSVDILVEYLFQLQNRYDRLGYETFVQEIYKLTFWIEIIENIHNN